MIYKEDIYIEPFDNYRTLHIYLPDDIQEGERLEVLYMFDGHNLFNDEDATYGKSWGIKDYLDNNHLRVMVVGIECNHEGNMRIKEYSPYYFKDDYFGEIEPLGKITAKWMVEVLKPYIDNKYPTLAACEYNYIGGSSMGGLISLYMISKYSKVYSKAVVVSPHIYPVFKDMKRKLKAHIKEHTEIYISWGAKEFDYDLLGLVTDQNLQLVRLLMKNKNVTVYPHVFKNSNHSEKSWQKELPTWMKELKIGKNH